MAYIDNLQDAAVQEFLELIAFDSPSWGEQAIASRLMAKLRELGTEPKIDKAGNIYMLISQVMKLKSRFCCLPIRILWNLLRAKRSCTAGQ